MATYIPLSTAAERLGVSVRTIRRYIAEGRLPAYRLGPTHIRVKVEDLDAMMQRIPTAGQDSA